MFEQGFNQHKFCNRQPQSLASIINLSLLILLYEELFIMTMAVYTVIYCMTVDRGGLIVIIW